MIVDYADAYIHSNMFVARVQHFSAFILYSNGYLKQVYMCI